MTTQLDPGTSLDGEAARRSARRRLAVVAVCWFLVFLDGIDTFVYGAVLPHMIGGGHLGLTDATAGAIGSYTTFGMLVGTILSGTSSNWIGRRRTVLASVTVFALATLGCGFAPTATTFGIFRLICGFGLGALLPIAISYGMEFTTGPRKALATGVIMSAHQVGGVVAPLLVLAVVDPLGWQSVFFISALPAVVLLPVAFKLLPEPPATLVTLGRRADADAVSERYGLGGAAPPPPRGPRGGGRPGVLRGPPWGVQQSG
ncbi:MFS transporter, partial [Isoptericola sp. NPDC056618]|uniref:MFS transporter n=1 Tax=Isoptericola sp. NPDC056618 TaxID=3345878 RepID=UPI0036A86B8E